VEFPLPKIVSNQRCRFGTWFVFARQKTPPEQRLCPNDVQKVRADEADAAARGGVNGFEIRGAGAEGGEPLESRLLLLERAMCWFRDGNVNQAIRIGERKPSKKNAVDGAQRKGDQPDAERQRGHSRKERARHLHPEPNTKPEILDEVI